MNTIPGEGFAVLADVDRGARGVLPDEILVWAQHPECDDPGWVYADAPASCIDQRDVTNVRPPTTIYPPLAFVIRGQRDLHMVFADEAEARDEFDRLDDKYTPAALFRAGYGALHVLARVGDDA